MYAKYWSVWYTGRRQEQRVIVVSKKHTVFVYIQLAKAIYYFASVLVDKAHTEKIPACYLVRTGAWMVAAVQSEWKQSKDDNDGGGTERTNDVTLCLPLCSFLYLSLW